MLRLLFVVFLIPALHARTVAKGNLAVVIDGQGVLSTPDNPVTADTPNLWCEGTIDDVPQQIASARFIRVHNRKEYEATLTPEQSKAQLIFGKVDVAQSGKYRCEITMQNGAFVYGNMFVYTKPTVHSNGSLSMWVSDDYPQLVLAETTKVSLGEKHHKVICPIYAYPRADVVWFKDGEPLEEDDRHKVMRDYLLIKDVQETDAGKYRCKASNRFAMQVDGPEEEFEVSLDQELKISGRLGWVLPLIIILIILLLLFIIIYTCQACKRYKSDQYNVERRERSLRRAEEQRLAPNKGLH